jgi:hypothetical protein
LAHSPRVSESDGPARQGVPFLRLLARGPASARACARISTRFFATRPGCQSTIARRLRVCSSSHSRESPIPRASQS